jgi:hypothetical protein
MGRIILNISQRNNGKPKNRGPRRERRRKVQRGSGEVIFKNPIRYLGGIDGSHWNRRSIMSPQQEPGFFFRNESCYVWVSRGVAFTIVVVVLVFIVRGQWLQPLFDKLLSLI